MFGAEEVYGAPESWFFWGVIFCSSGTDVRVLIINGQPFLPTWHPQNYPVIRDRPVAEGRFLFLSFFFFFFPYLKLLSFFFFFLSFFRI